MSDLVYPMGLIESLKVSRMDRVVSDEFEAGATAVRRMWPEKHFKRRFVIKHASLNQAEYKILLSFAKQRGTWDSFWFRDNVNRDGNAKVRFVPGQPILDEQRVRFMYGMTVTLEEVAPIRALPESDEVKAALGPNPLLWFDANREIYVRAGEVELTEPTAYDSYNQQYPATWQ